MTRFKTKKRTSLDEHGRRARFQTDSARVIELSMLPGFDNPDTNADKLFLTAMYLEGMDDARAVEVYAEILEIYPDYNPARRGFSGGAPRNDPLKRYKDVFCAEHPSFPTKIMISKFQELSERNRGRTIGYNP